MSQPTTSTKPPIDKVALFPIRDRKILMVRKDEDHLYINLGGKREPGETDLETLARECMEELSVKLLVETCRPAGVFTDFTLDGRPITSTDYFGEVEGEFVPGKEIKEWAWHTYADRNKTTPLGQKIFDFLKAQDLID